jgi:hypothetical protein
MVTHLLMQNKHTKEIFFWPTILGVITLLGLVLALVEDGWVEQFSLVGLTLPIVCSIYFYWFK